MENKKILIIGSGALGTAFSNILHDAGNKNILVYGINEKELSDLKQGKNTTYFSEENFINKVNTTNNFDEAIEGVSFIVIAIPSIAIPSIVEKINTQLKTKAIIICGSKGFWPDSEDPLHSGIVKATKKNENILAVTSILGPSYAEEIIKKSFTIVSVVSEFSEDCIIVQKLFSTSYFKIYRQTDIVGSEVGAIYKNILAIGVGMLVEKGFEINTIAAFITRGVHEMSVFNDYLGGSISTIMGLTGLGDLLLTSMSDNSRNRTFGRQFIKDKEKALKLNLTLEGLHALKIVNKIRIKNNLYLPIAKTLYEIIFENKQIDEAIPFLWDKELKAE
ncbi:MAG: NAD(P)H-dependent glycerol-3-phosphate dehydrogenase [Metamycoplasmataceae bacterium]